MQSDLGAIFDEAIKKRVFPGGVVWLAQGEQVWGHQAFGSTAYEDAISRPVSRDLLYDIASLSKLFTATAFLIAARDAAVGVEESVARFLPEFAASDKSGITLRQLLNHSSGISLAVQGLTGVPLAAWNSAIAAAPLHSAPGTKVLYSCTNYFLLGRVVEKLSGQTLDRFLAERLIEPLQLQRTTFRPLERFALDDIAPAEIDAGSGQVWHGVVHDEAARAWEQEGGACGNAGIFSTAADLAHFARLWLDEGVWQGRQILHPEDVRLALNDTIAEEDWQRGWCWQLGAVWFMSERAPQGSAGHAGFTGPTLVLNPHTRHVAIILNNRVYPTRNGPNRAPYHRRIARWLFGREEKSGG